MINETDLWNKALKGAMAIPLVKVDREVFLRKELRISISAGVNYWTSKPMANRLKRHWDEQLRLMYNL